MKKWLLLALVLMLPGTAQAQNAVTQAGSIIVNNLAKWKANRQIGDAGGINGDSAGLGIGPLAITDKNALGLCLNSAATTGPYNAFCLGHDSDSNALLSVDSYNGLGDKSFRIRINGVDYAPPGSIQGFTVVATNAALKALTVGAGWTRVLRSGFFAPGDAGEAIYDFRTTNCDAADNGEQVQPNVGTGCWVADFTQAKPNPVVWGATGDGVVNDTAAVQAALNAMAGRTLYLAGKLYNVGAITLPARTEINGETNATHHVVNACPQGFKANANNLNLITFADGYGSALRNLCILMATTAGTNSSGWAVTMGAASVMHMIERVQILNSCNGVQLNGNSIHMHRSMIEHLRGANCVGVSIGQQTTTKNTVDPRFQNNLIAGDNVTGGPATCLAAIWVYDAGGLLFDDNDILGCLTSTLIKPGANQQVDAGFMRGVFGDSYGINGLAIDTGASSAAVNLMQFVNGWTSGNGAIGNGIDVKNTGGGIVQGLRFIGHRSLGNGAHGAIFQGTISDISFIGGSFCGNGLGTPATYHGIALSAGISFGVISNVKASGKCDGYIPGGTQATGVFFGGNNDGWNVTGNDFLSQLVSPILGDPIGNSIVVNNLGVDTFVPTVTAAATMVVNNSYPSYIISGLTPISRMVASGAGAAPWNMRKVTFIPQGATPFVTGGATPGAICNNLTATANVPIVAVYNYPSNCWALK